MKTSIKGILTAVILITVISFTVKAQTNVSGGIYASTTWTKANSPYIVTDTVVVFPGVILTIEPGVTVEFADSIEIEIRQAQLIAVGTSTDSITFTSNSLSPVAGIYPGIYLNGGSLTSTFNYCNFKYATVGINVTVSDSVIVNNSYYYLDSIGFQFIGSKYGTEVALIDSSIFTNNEKQGLILEDLDNATINSCNFSNNIDGLILGNPESASNFSATTSYCNFSNNGTGLQMKMFNSTMNHCHFSNNTWGLEGGTGEVNNDFTHANYIKNCIFDLNQTGLQNIVQIFIDSCTIIHNQTGYQGGISRIKDCIVDSNTVTGLSSSSDSVINCIIKYNGGEGIQLNGSFAAIIGNDVEFNTLANIIGNPYSITLTENTIRYSNIGIEIDNYYNLTSFLITDNIIDYNDTGLILNASVGTFRCNHICNNTTYDLKYLASNNFDASHNYWCTDSASLRALIYDGYDNINYGLVSFMPFDSACSPTITSVNEIAQDNLFHIFPNPATNYLTVELPPNSSKTEIKIFNMLGELTYVAQTTKNKTDIEVSSLASGIYIIQIAAGNNVSRQKFIRQ